MSEWVEKSLGDLAVMRRGITYSAENLTEDEAATPYVNMKSFRKDGGFNRQGLKYFTGAFTREDFAFHNDLLIANTDVTQSGDIIGLPAFLPDFLRASGVLFSHHVTRLRLDGELDPEYLYYRFCTDEAHRNMLKYARGTTVLMLDMPALKRVKVEYPKSLDDQKRLIEPLRLVDEAIEATEALIAKYEQVKAGMMHDLFTRGLTPDGKLRPPREQAPDLYQNTPIGWIPKDWEVKPLGDFFIVQLGKMLSRAAKSGAPEFPYLGNKNVQWDRVDLSNLQTMSFSEREREKFEIRDGDLLMCEGGEVGRTALWLGELENCYFQKAIHRLRPTNEKTNTKLYLRYFRFAKDAGLLKNYTSQTSIAHLTREKLLALPLPIPHHIEQSDLSARFDAIDEKINVTEIDLQKLRQQKAGLMADLLTGKVAVTV